MKYLIVFVFGLVLISSAYAQLDIGYDDDDDDDDDIRAVIITPATPEVITNTTNGTLYHNNLLNLNWSVAGHTMDTDLDMNGHNITTQSIISTDSSIGFEIDSMRDFWIARYQTGLGFDDSGIFFKGEQGLQIRNVGVPNINLTGDGNITMSGYLDVDKNTTTQAVISSGSSIGIEPDTLRDFWLLRYATGLGIDDTGIYCDIVDGKIQFRIGNVPKFNFSVATGGLLVDGAITSSFGRLDLGVTKVGTRAINFLGVDNATIDWDGTNFDFLSDIIRLNAGTDQDMKLSFVGTTSTGRLKWMEDEDYFQFKDDVIFDEAINITGNLNVDGEINEVNFMEDLIMWLPFELGSNATYTRDYSNRSNNGDVKSATWDSDGGFDGFGVYNFTRTGGGDMINISYDSSQDITTGTWGAWLKSGQTNYPPGGGYIFFKWVGAQSVYGIYSTANDDYTCFFRESGGTLKQITDAINMDTKWHHIMCSYDGLILREYVDSVEAGTPQIISGTIMTGAGEFLIGDSDGSSEINAWNGTVDDLRVYDKVLRLEEIRDIYELRELKQSETIGDKIRFFFGGLIEEFASYFKFNKDVEVTGNVSAVNFSYYGEVGLTGNYSAGECWQYFKGGILTATNCTSV